jgi:hypothetical protein
MATYYGAQKSSSDGVLSWYDDQEHANYIIYRHNTKGETARYEGGDKETGAHRLNRFLTEIEPSDYAIYILQLIPGSKKKDATAPSVTFQLYKKEPFAYAQPNNYAMNELLSEIRAMKGRRNREDLDEEEDQEDDQVMAGPIDGSKPINFLNPGQALAGILAHPMIQNLLVTGIVNFMGKAMNSNTPAPVTAVSGVEEDSSDMAKSLEILLSKGVTPTDLAKLAAMDQGQINFLLSMLRK